MTGYTVHTGSNQKFASGWDRIFKKETRQTARPAAKKAKVRSTGRRKKS
jgi:hypothetical protein